MSNEIDEFDENDDASDGIKSLRNANKKLSKELEELREFKAQAERAKRSESVSKVFEAKGLPPKAAKFYDGEDVSEEAIGKWLEENGDVFGAAAKQQQSAAPTQAELEAQRVVNASYGTPNAVTDITPDQRGLLRFGDLSTLQQQMATLPMEELVRLGLLPQNPDLPRSA